MFHSPLVTCSLDNPLQTNKESALDEKMYYSAGSVWQSTLAMLLKNISRIFFFFSSSTMVYWFIIARRRICLILLWTTLFTTQLHRSPACLSSACFTLVTLITYSRVMFVTVYLWLSLGFFFFSYLLEILAASLISLPVYMCALSSFYFCVADRGLRGSGLVGTWKLRTSISSHHNFTVIPYTLHQDCRL